jgi:predicted ATPase
MITKLKLKNFKNFKQAEVTFGPVSVLVGANATGKSNVRDALRFLHGIARGYSLAEIIGEKYGEGGQLQWSGIRGGTREACFSGESVFTVAIEMERKESGSRMETTYSYEIAVQCGTNGSAPRVSCERLYKQEPQELLDLMVFDSHPRSEPLYQDDPMHLRVRLP